MNVLVDKSKQLAQRMHESHTRESGESLYTHLETVFNKMVSAGISDEKLLASAVLHHFPSLVANAEEIITAEVDKEVAQIVKTYHHLSQKEINRESPKHFNENFIVQTYINLAQDMRVLVLALANQCHNIETAYALSPDRRKQVAEKTLFLYAPIAKMLGISDFTKTLENESFKILNPAMYVKIQKAMEQKTDRIKKFFDEAVPIVTTFLQESGIEADTAHRIKHLYSIYRKSERYLGRGVEVGENFDSIYDIGAMRIITGSVDQVYATEDILKSLWEQIPNLRDDYIQKPRPSGYRSLHNTFVVEPDLHIEVQIRTREMHEESEYGVSSHLFYKLGEKFKNELEKNPNWVKDLNYYASYDKVTINHFTNNVYAFTPKGDILELPRGARALDFAYYLHSEIGNSCVGAKINGNIAKLDTLIQDGDIVEILLDRKRRKPSRDWLDLAGTKKARWEILKELRKGA